MKKVLYISGTRADYGLMKDVLLKIKKHSNLSLEIAATGMHLMDEFGKTINEIKKDGFIIHNTKTIYKKDNKESMARFIGETIVSLIKIVKKTNPNFIMVLGDRGEMLAGAIVGSYLRIPVIHIHGGEVTDTVDEVSRHAITKLSNIHFAATEKSAKRIIKMGESKKFVFNVGAPGVESMLRQKTLSKKDVFNKYKLKENEPLLLLVQHPADDSFNPAGQIKETLEAIKELKIQTIIVYPNSDAGGRKMIEVIKKYNLSFMKSYKSIPRKDFLSIMKNASAMIGNSSSGIIEAPSFGVPVVNIGGRNKDREHSNNLINVEYNKNSIKNAVKKALAKQFRKKVKKSKNPFEKKETAQKITQIIEKIKIDKNITNKKITY